MVTSFLAFAYTATLHHCHNDHQLTAVSFVGTVDTHRPTVTAVKESHATPAVALEFVGATAFV